MLEHLPASLHGYAPTQRGHGDADRPAHGYLPEDFATDIVEFMDSLGIRSAAIVGSSSGGLVSQLVASTYPDRVSALVLISSPASLSDKPAVAAMWEEISALEDPLDRGFVEEFVRSTSPELLPEDLIDTLISESLKVPAGCDVYQDRYDIRALAYGDLLSPGHGASADSDGRRRGTRRVARPPRWLCVASRSAPPPSPTYTVLSTAVSATLISGHQIV